MADSRIEQFRKMAEADPGNELGQFSLGRACLEVGQFADAAAALRRVIDINAKNSRAYQLLATAQEGAGDRAAAIATLKKGYTVAHERGDLMPRNEMAARLRELGEEPPATPAAQPSSPPPTGDAASAGSIACSRCGQAGPRLPKPPFKGELGQQVYASVCNDCWREWLALGTKVINELRLDFARCEDAATYDQHMKEFLNLP